MVKFLVIGLGLFVLYKLMANDFLHKKSKNTAQSKQENEKKFAAGEMVKDPVCGTYIAVDALDNSIKVRDGSKTYNFCSYECRDKFLKQLQDGGRELPESVKKKDADDDEDSGLLS